MKRMSFGLHRAEGGHTLKGFRVTQTAQHLGLFLAVTLAIKAYADVVRSGRNLHILHHEMLWLENFVYQGACLVGAWSGHFIGIKHYFKVGGALEESEQ